VRVSNPAGKICGVRFRRTLGQHALGLQHTYKELQELEEAICRFYQEDILPLEAKQDVIELQKRDEGYRRF
jgi:hypothetical protein